MHFFSDFADTTITRVPLWLLDVAFLVHNDHAAQHFIHIHGATNYTAQGSNLRNKKHCLLVQKPWYKWLVQHKRRKITSTYSDALFQGSAPTGSPSPLRHYKNTADQHKTRPVIFSVQTSSSSLPQNWFALQSSQPELSSKKKKLKNSRAKNLEPGKIPLYCSGILLAWMKKINIHNLNHHIHESRTRVNAAIHTFSQK